MACTSCKDRISGVCKVCQALDNDEKVKIVTYCNTCGVYICKDCNTDLIRRLQAFLKIRL